MSKEQRSTTQQGQVVSIDKNIMAVCPTHSKDLQKLVTPNGAIKVGIGSDDNREWVWALKTRTKGVYKIDNVPMFVQGYSLGDHVRVKKTDDGLVAGKTVKHSGNKTFGLLIETGNAIRDAVLKFLIKQGCFIEGTGVNYWGVNVPKNDDGATDIYLLLLHKTNPVKAVCLSHNVDMDEFDKTMKGFPGREKFLAEFESRFPKPKAA